MSLWEKIKSDLQRGAVVVSEKTSELVREGTEVVKEGAEAASQRVAYTTRLTQLNLEHRKIEKSMDEEFRTLGNLAFTLHAAKRIADLNQEADAVFGQLRKKSKELSRIEKEKQELAASQSAAAVDKESVKGLAQSLDEAGGILKQVALDKESPVIGKKLKEIRLPKEALIGTIVREDRVIIPDGNTAFKTGDKVTLLGKTEDVEKAVALMIQRG